MDNNYSGNYNTGNERNSDKTTVILGAIIIVLLIVAIVLGVLYFTKTNNSSNNNNNNSNNQNNNNNNNNTPTEKTLTNEELNKYLSYVPMLLEYDVERTGEFSDAGYGFNIDAYTGKSVTISDLDKRLLLLTAFNMTEKDNVKVAGNYSWCGGTSCTGDEYVSVEKLNSALKRMYNMDNAGDTVGSKFRMPAGVAEKSDQYYVRYNGMGSVPIVKRLSKVEKYNVQGDTLTIYERAGFTGTVKLWSDKVLRYTNEENDEKEDFKNGATEEEIKKYFEDNANKFAIFKHTFKLGSNNEYYYYSTEESK